MILSDESQMPFGPHQGTKMKDIPLPHLHFIWNHTVVWNEEQEAVMDWIEKNLVGFKMQTPNHKWKKR